MEQLFYFLLQYAPFWGVPLFLITLEFAYIYWLKQKRGASLILLTLALIATVFVLYYYWAGGPDQVLKKLYYQLH